MGRRLGIGTLVMSLTLLACGGAGDRQEPPGPSSAIAAPDAEGTSPDSAGAVPASVLEAALARGIDTADPLEYRIDDFVAVLLIEQLSAQLDVQALPSGLEVVRAPEGSLLARLGLAKGDVILSVNGRELDSAGALALALATGSRVRIELGVRAAGETGARVIRYRIRSGLALRESGLDGARHDEDPPTSRTAPTRRSPDLTDPLRPDRPTLGEGAVEKLDTDHYRIDRAALRGLLEDSTSLARSARVIPSTKDGEVQGFKLYGIRRSSPLGELGFENGDLVRSVAGRDLRTPDDALAAYTALKEASRVDFELERHGRRVVLVWEIR